MIAELVSVGTELLLGEILNSNAAFLSRKLAALGIDLYHQVTVGDNRQRLRQVLETALGRADLVITTGGLGPTMDDITRDVVAEVTGCPLTPDGEILAALEGFFAARGTVMSDNNRRQALVPQGALPIPNLRGTAPGLFLSLQTTAADEPSAVICLPGPPAELEPMMEEWVLPRLARWSGGRVRALYKRVLKVCGLGESRVEDLVKDILDSQENPTIAPYAKPGEVHLRLAAKADSEAAAHKLMAPVEEQLRRRLGNHIYGVDDDTLEGVVGGLLAARRLTLTLAESCTGGLLGHRLTNVPGSSEYFRLGVVVYHNTMKTALLGVPEATLAARGAVSEDTVLAMARGALSCGGTDLALAVSGIAGPGGGTPEKPVGTVYLAVAAHPRVASNPAGRVAIRRECLRGNREQIKHWASQAGLVLLRRFLLEQLEAGSCPVPTSDSS